MRTRRLLAHFCLAVWLFLAGAGVALYRVDDLIRHTFGGGKGLMTPDELPVAHLSAFVSHYMAICRITVVILGFIITLALYGGLWAKNNQV